MPQPAWCSSSGLRVRVDRSRPVRRVSCKCGRQVPVRNDGRSYTIVNHREPSRVRA